MVAARIYSPFQFQLQVQVLELHACYLRLTEYDLELTALDAKLLLLANSSTLDRISLSWSCLRRVLVVIQERAVDEVTTCDVKGV